MLIKLKKIFLLLFVNVPPSVDRSTELVIWFNQVDQNRYVNETHSEVQSQQNRGFWTRFSSFCL